MQILELYKQLKDFHRNTFKKIQLPSMIALYVCESTLRNG